MITIKEMAEMLGISTTTVSNVINGKTSEVSQKTAEKVQKLLDEYDYVPNMNAKNLAQNHSRLIGIVLKRKKDKYDNIFCSRECAEAYYDIQEYDWTESDIKHNVIKEHDNGNY